MVNTKRRIDKEMDRYGGYGTEIGRSPLVSQYDKIVNSEPSAESMIVSDTDFNIKNSATAEPQFYTRLDSAVAPTPTRQAAELPPRPEKAQKSHEREDILPTVKTQAYAAPAIREKAEETSEEQTAKVARPVGRERHSLDARTKILLCIYVMVALILAIAVIATGVSISHATVETDSIQEQIALKQAVIAEQQATLAGLNDSDAIRGKAIENGMVAAGNPTYTASATQTFEYPQATPHENGFDEFCDWLSKVVG